MANNNKTHQYQSVKADERDEIDDLDMHIEDPLDLDEKDYMHTASPPRTRRARILEVLNRYRWVIDGFLVAIVVMLLVDRQWTSSGKTSKVDAQYEGTGDVTGFAPRCTCRYQALLVIWKLTSGQSRKRL